MIKVNEKQSENNAITLISLVITIIILIILASVVIYFGLNNNGIFNKAKEAKELTNKETATEKINLKITTAQMNKYADKQVMPTLKEISEVLREDNEIAYVTEKSQIASKKYEVGENPSSIFTKLKEYPYEFEINSSLQLASINGVKMSTENIKESNMKVLWENPLKTEFSEQIITWGGENLSEGTKEGAETYKYDYLILEYETGKERQTEMISKGNGTVFFNMYEDTSGTSYYIMERRVTYISNVALKFSNVKTIQMKYTGGYDKHLNWNNCCIPLKIIGVK